MASSIDISPITQTNSSPPIRPNGNPAENNARVRVATCFRTSSPARWPNRSLTSLKRSRSTYASAQDVPSSLCAAIAFSTPRRFSDPLTGSLNRRGVEKAIAAQSEEGTSWALAYVDLDRFKLVNDLFGHRAGDEVLKQVATRTRALFSAGFPFGRIGGDEFVCVMGDMSIDEAIDCCQ